MKTTTAVRIHDVQDETTYVANTESDCKDATDRSGYQECVKRGDVITMGKVIFEPLP